MVSYVFATEIDGVGKKLLRIRNVRLRIRLRNPFIDKPLHLNPTRLLKKIKIKENFLNYWR